MINFFKHIRRKLLRESGFRKYLLYALGEIALVVIGILLALQINNWKENFVHLMEEKDEVYEAAEQEIKGLMLLIDAELEEQPDF